MLTNFLAIPSIKSNFDFCLRIFFATCFFSEGEGGGGGQRHLMTKYDIKNEAANLSSCCEILSRVGIYHHLSEGSTTTYLTDLPPLI